VANSTSSSAGLLTGDGEVAALTAGYLSWIGPTLFLFGGTLAILAFLEQIGRGGWPSC